MRFCRKKEITGGFELYGVPGPVRTDNLPHEREQEHMGIASWRPLLRDRPTLHEIKGTGHLVQAVTPYAPYKTLGNV